MTRPIYVFGSNLAGRHGKGSAYEALRHRGAIYGQGVGLQGEAYGIPTKDEYLVPLPLPTIAKYVAEFLAFAREHPELMFEVVPIGCSNAGYVPTQIAPFFEDAPINVILPEKFLRVLFPVETINLLDLLRCQR